MDVLFAENDSHSPFKSSFGKLTFGILNTCEMPKSAIKSNSSQSFFREDYERIIGTRM